MTNANSQLFTLIILIWISGCSIKRKHENTIVINFNKATSNKTFHNLMFDAEIIKVKSNFIPKKVYEMLIDQEGSYYLKDFIATLSRGIIKLDSLGNEVFLIDKKGRGAKEFSSIDAFTLVENSLIYFDGIKRRFMLHDSKTGEFMTHKLYKKGAIDQISTFGNSLVALEIRPFKQVSSVCILDKNDFSRSKTLLRNNSNFNSFYGSTIIPINDQEFAFKNSLHDTIYKIKNDRIAETLCLDFGNDHEVMSDLAHGKMSHDDRMKLYANSDINKVVSKVLSFEGYLGFKSRRDEEEFFDVIDLKHNKGLRYKFNKDIIPFPIYVRGVYFYSVVAGEYLEGIIKNIRPIKFDNEEIKDRLGNTFILKYKLRL